jgi:hypothetical protein
MEVRGFLNPDEVIYDFRFPVRCLGAIDPLGGDPLPVASGGVTLDTLYTVTSNILSGVEDDFTALQSTVTDTLNAFTEDFSTLSTEVQEAADAVIGFSTDINIITGRIEANAVNIDNLSSEISGVADDVTALGLALAETNDNVEGISSDFEYMMQEFEAVTGMISGKQDTSTVLSRGSLSGNIDFNFADGDIQTCIMNGPLLLENVYGFNVGDCAAFIVSVPTSGHTFLWPSEFGYGKYLINQNEQGDFSFGIICIAPGYYKMMRGDVL